MAKPVQQGLDELQEEEYKYRRKGSREFARAGRGDAPFLQCWVRWGDRSTALQSGQDPTDCSLKQSLVSDQVMSEPDQVTDQVVSEPDQVGSENQAGSELSLLVPVARQLSTD